MAKSNGRRDMVQMGAKVPGWTPARPVDVTVLAGPRVRLEHLDPDAHAAGLFDAYRGHDHLWDYMPYGPFAARTDYTAFLHRDCTGADPYFLTVRDAADGTCLGVASFLRITPAMGTIEVGHICMSPRMQGKPSATETMFLMADWAFSNGYRRYEWKCNALNLPSRRAAQRLGFSFEGVFRQAAVIKGHNRDTAWFGMTDGDWARLRPQFLTWLAPDNFDAAGGQRRALSDLTAPLLFARDPALD
jgi:RimJ/RimL family protein N-acetyltransferase